MTDIYRIADTIISITSLYNEVHWLCTDYRSGIEDGLPVDIDVVTAKEDIDYERIMSARQDEANGIPVRHFSDAYLETLAVYRRIAEAMPCRDTVLLHGSAVAVDGEGYIFMAKSGTGKSTHTRLWRELLGDRAVMVNDDKPLIRVKDSGAVVYGTPWDGKHRLSNNMSVPLRAVCILERSEYNTIRQINARDVYPMLLQQIYRPGDAAAMAMTLTLVDRLAASVSLWRLGCNTDIEAAEVAYYTMKGAAAAASEG